MKPTNKPIVSIIIVNYHVKKELYACISSVIKTEPKISYEILVVDNDEKKTLHKDLLKKYPFVKYIPNENKGFGQGNNTGVKYAKGKYYFFLNPDTRIHRHCLDILVACLRRAKDTAIAAPFLYDLDGKLVPLQGARKLTPLSTIFSFSFIHKLLPNNFITKKYWYLNEWDKSTLKEVKSIPGTAFMIKKEVYTKLKGFDENFFLYFEEHDLCNRVIDLGKKIIMIPEAKVIHALGRSTSQSSDNINAIFNASRYYYLKKHFGITKALMSEAILRFNKYYALLAFIVILGTILRFYKLEQTMSFIGDQGWFYLSARDLLIEQKIPLVGITSSHTWINQGALWTYLLAPILWIFQFNPISGAYLAIVFDVLSIILLYKVGEVLFSKQTGLIAATLYSFSHLIILTSRIPYHTTPIPFFTILAIYFFYKWLQGSPRSFVVLIFLLGVLYNLQLSTALFGVLVFSLFLIGIYKKAHYVNVIINKKYIILSFIAYLISMLPMLLYDLSHKFVQTVGFIVWMLYKVVMVFGFPTGKEESHFSYFDILAFGTERYMHLVFPYSMVVSTILFIMSFIYLIDKSIKKNKNAFLLLILNSVLIIGFFVAKTPSGAYVPLLLPGLLLSLAYMLSTILRRFPLSIILFILMIISNIQYLLLHNYTFVPQQNTFTDRLNVAKYIVKEANGKEYNLIGSGNASQFSSFTMNYEYLAWWLGNGPTKEETSLKFSIEESDYQLKVKKITK